MDGCKLPLLMGGDASLPLSIFLKHHLRSLGGTGIGRVRGDEWGSICMEIGRSYFSGIG